MNQTYYLIKCISLWNVVKESSLYFFYKCYYLYVYLKAYAIDSHNRWVFIPGHTLPLALTSISNNVEYLWSYSSTDNKLMYKHCTTSYPFSWLSAKLVIYQNELSVIEYDIDDFLHTFRIATKLHRLPTLTMVFIAWSTYTKQWFKSSSIIEFHIINDSGEDQVLSLHQDNACLHIDQHKIHSYKI